MNEKIQANSDNAPCGVSQDDMRLLVARVNILMEAYNQTVVMLTDIHKLIKDMSDGGAGK